MDTHTAGVGAGSSAGGLGEPLIQARITGVPRPQGAIKTFVVNGKARGRHSNTTLDHRMRMAHILAQNWNGLPPLLGPVALVVDFLFSRPKSHFGTGRNADKLKASAPVEHTQTPDVDKLLRLVCDALCEARIIRDDSQVVMIFGIKSWADSDYTDVLLYRMDGENR